MNLTALKTAVRPLSAMLAVVNGEEPFDRPLSLPVLTSVIEDVVLAVRDLEEQEKNADRACRD